MFWTRCYEGELGYSVIALVASIVLLIDHILRAESAPLAKAMTAIVVLVAAVLLFRYAQWFVVALLLQVAVSVYMLLHARLTR